MLPLITWTNCACYCVHLIFLLSPSMLSLLIIKSVWIHHIIGSASAHMKHTKHTDTHTRSLHESNVHFTMVLAHLKLISLRCVSVYSHTKKRPCSVSQSNWICATICHSFSFEFFFLLQFSFIFQILIHNFFLLWFSKLFRITKNNIYNSNINVAVVVRTISPTLVDLWPKHCVCIRTRICNNNTYI